jgi:hypothetical protein
VAASALFGLIDGLNGAVGLIVGLLHAHAAASLIFVAILSRAGASSVSMAGAEYESAESGKGWLRTQKVAAMGAGYLTSALLPGLGFAFGIRPGLIVFVPASIAILGVVAWYRHTEVGWRKAIITTVVIFALAVIVGLLAGLA